MRWITAVWILVVAAGCSPTPEQAPTVSVSAPAGGALAIDGEFDDWAFPAHVVDAQGDGVDQGLDLGSLWTSDQDGNLLFRLEVGRETIAQEADPERAGADLTLHLDLDASPATGAPLSGLGVDLSVYFGRRVVLRYDGEHIDWLSLNDIGSLVMPTHSSDEFEFRMALDAFDGAREEPKAVRFVFSDGPHGDRLPDDGYVELTLSGSRTDPVAPIAWERPDDEHLRMLVHNTERTGIVRNPDPYRRYLAALQPDLVALQEVYDWTEPEAVEFFDDALPLSNGDSWSATAAGDTMVVSRWPIDAAGTMGDENVAALLDTPNGKLVVVSAHTPCCGNEEGRDLDHGLIAEQVRKILDGSGLFRIEETTPVVVAGDFNTVGFRRQVEVLEKLTWDADTTGPTLTAVPLRHTHTNDTYTWRKDTAGFGPGRLDWVFYTADRIQVRQGFALWTPDVPNDVLSAMGLEQDDSPAAADHLVLVVDFVSPR